MHMNLLKHKDDLALVKAQTIDVTNFENERETFKSAFAKNFDLVPRLLQTAIDEIDKSKATDDGSEVCRVEGLVSAPQR